MTLSLPVWLLTTTAPAGTVVEAETGGANVNMSPVVTRIDAAPTLRPRSSVALTALPLWMVFTAFVIVHENPLITIVLFDSGEVYHLT